MNRIAGILNLDRAPVCPEETERMLAALKHPGRAEGNSWIHGVVSLGCTRAAGNAGLYSQPRAEGLVITFDGRIDNRQELLAALRTQLVTPPSQISDEELLLAAYEKWELGCPQHLVGDFAFAIWDEKKGRLICVRDHFGAKPLYYHQSKTSFLFASAPEALLASGKVPSLIHEERVADHLVNPLDGIDKTSSLYLAVFRLPPAHMLIVTEQGMTLKRYWELCPTFRSDLKTEDEYVEAFKELFTEAVRCRLYDVPASGSMLSGGIDSSAMAGVARRILSEQGRDPVHAFAVISNLTNTNRETSYISAVLSQGNLQPHLISETELLCSMDELVQAIEAEAEPFDWSFNLNRAVYLHARDENIRALLDGVDGDILLAGSGYLIQLWREGALRTILAETFQAEGLIAEYAMGTSLFLDSFLSVATPFAPCWYRRLRRPIRNRKALESAVRDTLINHGFAVRSRLGERFAVLDSHSPRLRSFRQTDAHKIALEHPSLTVGLERYERVASTFGIEARHPLLDVRLAEFCMALPWQLKTRRGWTKLILRRAMVPYLPAEVVWRKDKDSLMWEVNRLILKERAEYFYQITCDEQASLRPYIDIPKLMKFWQAYLTLGDEKHALLLWSGIALALWLRRHRDMQTRLITRREAHA